MPLFRPNGEPMKFHLVDIDREEVIALRELIEGEGGEVVDDEETLVKFTSRDMALTKLYVRAKIYDVAFIVESLKEKRFVEPEKYRLGKKIPGDEFIMLHFLYGDCSCARKEIESMGNQPQGAIVASQNNNSQRLVISQNSDVFATAPSSNADEDQFQSTEMDLAVLNPPSNSTPLHGVMSIFFDESQPVVDRLELAMIYKSSLASGDVAENVDATEEKRPCNLEYERDVKPKITVLAEEARRSVRSGEKLSVRKSPRPRRSPRTVARKSVDENVTDNEKVQSDVQDPENFSSSSNNQNEGSSDTSTIQVVDIETPDPPIEVIQIDESPANLSPPKPKTPQKATRWISTKKPASKKVTNDGENSKAVQPSNESEITIVRNIQHRANENSGKSSERAGKSNLPERTERRRTKKIHKDGNSGSKKTMEKERSERVSESESGSEPRPVANGSKKRKQTGRKARPARKTFFDQIYGSSESSSSSLGGKPPKSKKSRRRVSLSDSSDEIVISDPDSDKQPQPHRREGSDEAGPSGVLRERQNCTDDDESSDTETHRNRHKPETQVRVHKSVSRGASSRDQPPNGIKRRQDNPTQNKKSQPQRRNRPEEAEGSDFGNEQENDTDDESSEEERKPKIEMHVDRSVSRGKLWRAKLLNGAKCHYNILSRKPFTPVERLKMLRYLIKKNAIHMAKGLVIWTRMINDGLLTHRTPQSLQNHFVKHILPNIRTIDCILSEDMKKFLALKGEK